MIDKEINKRPTTLKEYNDTRLIADVLASILGTFIYRIKYPKDNKYVVFTVFFIGFFLFFKLIST